VTRRAIVESLVEHERASATPVVHGRVPHPSIERSSDADLVTRHVPETQSEWILDDGSLRARQEWFARAVMSPETMPAPSVSETDRVLTSGPHLSSLDRLEVYRRAYHGRLVECLADDYPALQASLGDPAFERIARAYIARYPSTSPNLNAYGGRMAEFCESEAPLERPAVRPFLTDLASLEWAIVEVIHAPGAEPLTLAGLSDVPIEQWADARLATTPAFRLLRFRYPVNLHFQAFREGRRPAVPEAAASAAAVYRNTRTIWRMDLTDPMFDLLGALASGDTLGASLERAAAAFADVGEDVAVTRVMAWFREWVQSGLFSGVSFG
jgi:hypothetical protein